MTLETENIFFKIFESAPDAVIVVDARGKILMASNQVKNLFGYEKDELNGQPIEVLIPESYKHKHEGQVKGYAHDPKVREMGKGLSLKARKKDGSEFAVEISLSPVQGSKGLYVSAAIRDVTDRDKLIADLKVRDEMVSEQNKRLLNFAFIVSHNLRSYGVNFSTLLKFLEEAKSEEEEKTIKEQLVRMTDGLNETIKNLDEIVTVQMDINRQKEKINLRHYINKALEILKGDLSIKNVTIHNHVPIDVEVDYNPAYMESVLINFFTNSIKYSHPNRPPVIEISSFMQGERLVLQVEDNGVGIDLDKYGKKLFGMYNTFHGNKDARGVGLFITKNQVEAMGGKVEVESVVNEGTTFRVYLT